MLQVKGLSVHYGMIEALTEVSLLVRKGQIVSLIGANGAGKSSLLNAISGVIPASSGEVLFENTDLHEKGGREVVSRGVVQVPEGRQVFGNMTVLENLQLGGYSRRQEFRKSDMDLAFELFPRLAERRRQLAGLMSGGEQQMLAIGRALMAKPRLLLLDEPSMGLAPLVVKSIFATLRQLNDDGLSILLVEQNAKAALRLSNYCYVLTTGRLTRHGRSADLLDDAEINAAFLGKHVEAIAA